MDLEINTFFFYIYITRLLVLYLPWCPATLVTSKEKLQLLVPGARREPPPPRKRGRSVTTLLLISKYLRTALMAFYLYSYRTHTFRPPRYVTVPTIEALDSLERGPRNFLTWTFQLTEVCPSRLPFNAQSIGIEKGMMKLIVVPLAHVDACRELLQMPSKNEHRRWKEYIFGDQTRNPVSKFAAAQIVLAFTSKKGKSECSLL